MAINDALLNVGAGAIATAAAYAQIHTGAPNASGSNEATTARKLIDWTVPAAGDISLEAPLAFTGGAASGPATHIGFWSAATAGVFYGWLALTGDQTFNAAGEYTVNAITLNSAVA